MSGRFSLVMPHSGDTLLVQCITEVKMAYLIEAMEKTVADEAMKAAVVHPAVFGCMAVAVPRLAVMAWL